MSNENQSSVGENGRSFSILLNGVVIDANICCGTLLIFVWISSVGSSNGQSPWKTLEAPHLLKFWGMKIMDLGLRPYIIGFLSSCRFRWYVDRHERPHGWEICFVQGPRPLLWEKTPKGRWCGKVLVGKFGKVSSSTIRKKRKGLQWNFSWRKMSSKIFKLNNSSDIQNLQHKSTKIKNGFWLQFEIWNSKSFPPLYVC